MNKLLSLTLISATLATSCAFGMEEVEKKPILLECASVTFQFDALKFRDQLSALQAMPVDGIEIVGETLSLKQKEQVRTALLSHIALLNRMTTEGTNLIINRNWMTSLPEKSQPELPVPTPTVTKQTLAHKIFNPTTLTACVVCAITTYLAAKHTQTTNI